MSAVVDVGGIVDVCGVVVVDGSSCGGASCGRAWLRRGNDRFDFEGDDDDLDFEGDLVRGMIRIYSSV